MPIVPPSSGGAGGRSSLPGPLPRRAGARVPKYRLHKPSGRALVQLGGRRIYLGKHGTPESLRRYAALLAQLAEAPEPSESTQSAESTPGGVVPAEAPAATQRPRARLGASPARPAAPGRRSADDPPPRAEGLTVVELIALYWDWAQGYYQRDGRPTDTLGDVRYALRALREAFGALPAADFGPLKLFALQERLVAAGLARRTINKRVEIVKRVFRWAVSRELLPPAIHQALATVPGLRLGRCNAREPEPVRPVDDAVVEATLPYLPPVVADLVRFQRLTGCRPGEACRLRPRDVDRSGRLWVYVPPRHKTELHGKARLVVIGPRAQAVLAPYLLRGADEFCFRPAESERRRLAERHARRRTPLSCGNRPGTNRRRRPRRVPGDCYDTRAYARAIRRAVAQANRELLARHVAAGGRAEDAPRLPVWSPNRLRHTAATAIRRAFGLEAAQVVLGHARADVTQVYAERDLQRAFDVMERIG